MCGIGGIVLPESERPQRDVLEQMSSIIRERGPDDHGLFLDDGIGLVHRRLSVMDTSSAGHCPMLSESGNEIIVFNGEVFNFREIRKELVALGYTFRSESDTEVVVNGYQEWGSDVIHRMDGMFAVAIWDKSARELWLARDRFGKKPLYFVDAPGYFAFSSSISALRAAAPQASLNSHALVDYLVHGYISGPDTIWKDFESLPPASMMKLRAKGRGTIERYWDLPKDRLEGIRPAEAEELIEHDLAESVRARLVADVPVGGFLSGGVDSSLVMAMAAREKANISSFTIGFAEDSHNELPYAKQVAERLGTDHHELVLNALDLLDVIPELVWQYGQPYGDPSCIPAYCVSKLARELVTVSLTGDGGDELFGGYYRAITSRYTSLYAKWMPDIAIRKIIPSILPSNQKHNSPLNLFARMNKRATEDPVGVIQNIDTWNLRLSDLLGDAIVGEKPATSIDREFPKRIANGGFATDLQNVLYDDIKGQLANDYLVKIDVASMAVGLEVRAPMLDHHFAETAWRIPDNLKVRWGSGKWLLKRLAAKHVPRSVIYRKKMGFSLPLDAWWRGELAEVLEVLMQDSRVVDRGWIRREPVLRALREHRGGTARHENRLWLILWLELWARICVEQSMPRTVKLNDIRS